MGFKDILLTLEYEFMSGVESLKRTDSWMYLVSLLAIVFAVTDKMILLVICLLSLIIIQMKRDYDTGKVKAYQREKYKNQILDNEGRNETAQDYR